MGSVTQSVALLSPIVASNAIFGFRRAARGVDAIGENTPYGIVNCDIAAGQAVKGTKATVAMLENTNTGIGEIFGGAGEKIKEISKSSKFLSGLGNVVKFTAEYINWFICLASGVKIVTSDNKVDTAAREILSLGTMFGCEGLFKKYATKMFQNAAKSCGDQKLFGKIPVKALIGIAQGLGFAGASIGGYKIGAKFGDTILGKQKKAKAAA